MKATKRLTVDALLAALALLLFIVEMQIPPLTAIPGIKIGLANVVTLFAIVFCGRRDAACILFVRIVLGAVFAGNLSTFIYSATGGVLCWCVMCLFFTIIKKPVWAISILGAMAHNIGQLLAASVMLRSGSVWWYLPYLLLAAVVSGAFTGVCATLLLKRIHKKGIE